MESDTDLMKIHIETLFTHTLDGRLLNINEPNGRSAPRFFLGRTLVGNICRFRHDLPKGIIHQLTDLAQNEPLDHPLSLEPEHNKAYKELLQAHAPIENIWSGPAYQVPILQTQPGEVVKITPANTNLLPEAFGWLRECIDEEQPCFAVLEDGRAVSICRSVRIGAQAHEAGVETVAGYRGRGFAPEVVRAWATAVHDLGMIPLYSTSWQNQASQGVADKLGLIMYGVTLYIT